MSSAKIEIWRTGDGAYTDYSAWLWSGDEAIFSKEHGLNEPQRCTFALQDGTSGFQVPQVGNRVRITTTPYGVTFVGYITAVPRRELLGQLASGTPAFGYHCEAVSEELRLEWKTASLFPTLPPFVNKYQGQIVKELITILGGGPTTTNVDDGILIPYFRVRPEEGFMDAVRRLSDRTQMVFWTSNGAAYYKFFGNYLGDGNDLSSWTLTQLTLSADQLADPDGLQVIDLLTPTGGAGNCNFRKTVTPRHVEGRTFVFRMLAKRTGSLVTRIEISNQSGTVRGALDPFTPTSTLSEYSVSATMQAGDSAIEVRVGGGSPGSGRWLEAEGSLYVGRVELTEDASFPFAAQQSDSQFDPHALSIDPINAPVLNDVIAVGEVEPQVYVREYFVGDGLKGSFPLKFPLFGAQSSKLLEDDFTGTAIDANRWTETDPDSLISISGNSLRFQASGASNRSRLSAVQGVEVGGVIELRAGRVKVNGGTDALIGCLLGADTGLIADVIAGFRLTPTGGQATLQSVVSGAVAGPTYVTVSGRTYQFVLTVNCSSRVRRRRSFYSQASQFGGEDVTANATVSFSVIELPDNESDKPTEVLKHTATISSIAAFLFYTVVAGPVTTPGSADISLNFTLLRTPISAELWTRKVADSAYVQRRLGDKADPEAWAAIVPGTEGHELIFFQDRIPEAREKIRLMYRQAGQARARVRRDASVTLEASRSGDSGVRAGVLPDIQPAPRDSAELERALQAFIDDSTRPLYEGEWSLDTARYTPVNEPVPGKVLLVDCSSIYPKFYARVRHVRSDFLFIADIGDVIRHTVSFGPILRLEEEQGEFVPPEGALVGPFDTLIDVPQVEFGSVGTSFSADRPDGFFDGTLTASQAQLDMGVAPTSAYEVRKTDAGWGSSQTINDILASDPTTQTFLIPRATRDILAFIKNRDGSGKLSRYPTAIRLVYPLPPAQPDAMSVVHEVTAEKKSTYVVTVKVLEANVRDLYQVELRDEDNSTVLARWGLEEMSLEAGYFVARYTFDNSTALDRSRTFNAYQRNLLDEYSVVRQATGIQNEPLKPALIIGNSVGQVIEWLFEARADSYQILETHIQAAGPSGSFTTPDHDVKLPGNPEKFSFTATSSGAWAFRARYRDAIGWSPWSNESQGQIGSQTFIYTVVFFRADEMDSSLGAAFNQQNLIANGEFFLAGIGGQEGTNSAKYFALANALSDGTEVQHQASTNEMKWKSGVNFASANPGFKTLYTNLGKLLNPGEAVTVNVALRHDGGSTFGKAVRIALRSAGTSSYDMTRDVPASTIPATYEWYSATFILSTSAQVPDDLQVEVTVVTGSGTSISSNLFADKITFNRGHRPMAFSLSLWDAAALSWNGGASAYDLPSAAVAASPRSTNPGSAGDLMGTGTEAQDPAFTGRYQQYLT